MEPLNSQTQMRDQNLKHPLDNYQDDLKIWFSDLEKQTYFIPPVHFNRVPCAFGNERLKGFPMNFKKHHVLVNITSEIDDTQKKPPCKMPESIFDKDLREDRALEMVNCCLRELADDRQSDEVMVVLSRLPFGPDYKKKSYTPPEACITVAASPDNTVRTPGCDSVASPSQQGNSTSKSTSKHHSNQQGSKHQSTPSTSKKECHPKKHRALDGDFDVLIIHRKYGLIHGEIKSVGSNFETDAHSEKDPDSTTKKTIEKANQDKTIVDVVKKALKQLKTAKHALKEIVTGFSGRSDISIRTTLMVPNLSSNQLLKAIKTDDKIAKELCEILGVSPNDVDTAVKMCLCLEQVKSISKASNTSSSEVSEKVNPGELTTPEKSETRKTSDLTNVNEERRKWWKHVTRDQKPLESLYKVIVVRFCYSALTLPLYFLSEPRLQTGHRLKTRNDGIHEIGEKMSWLTLFPEQVTLINEEKKYVFLHGPPGAGKTVVLLLQGLHLLQKKFDVHVVSTWRKSQAASFSLEKQLKETIDIWGSPDLISNVHRHYFDLGNFHNVHEEVDKAIAKLKSNESNKQLALVLADEAGPDDDYSHPFTVFCDRLIEAIPEVYVWATALPSHVRPSRLDEHTMKYPLRCPPAVAREVEKASEIQTGAVHNYSYNTTFHCDGLKSFHEQHENGIKGHTGAMPDDCEECGKVVAKFISETFSINNTETSSPLKYKDVFVLCDIPRDNSGLVRGLRGRGVPVTVVEYGSGESEIKKTALCLENTVTVTHWDYVRGLERKVVFVTGRGELEIQRLHGMSRCSSQLIQISAKVAETESTLEVKFWLKCISQWYPDLHNKTHFLPPLHFDRSVPKSTGVAASETLEPGEKAVLVDSGRDSDDDHAQERFLLSLQAIAEKEKDVMMVLSQLRFGKHLNRPCFAAGAALSPTPEELPQYRGGDHDVLIIHNKYGLIYGEVKRVGADYANPDMTEEDKNKDLERKLEEAKGQLQQRKIQLDRLVSDLQWVKKDIKILIMPNIDSRRLSNVLKAMDTKSVQELCSCLNAKDKEDLVHRCLLSEQLPDRKTPWKIEKHVLEKLIRWWKKSELPSEFMTVPQYELLVARFCGPLTTVDVFCISAPYLDIRPEMDRTFEKTKGMGRFVLYPQQIYLLNTTQPRIFLSGPPGTGKTMTLIMQGLKWLQQRNTVHIVSLWPFSRAVSRVIEHQMKETFRTWSSLSVNMRLHTFDLTEEKNIKSMIETLKSEASGKTLCVLVDEAIHDYTYKYSNYFTKFCNGLIAEVKATCMWAASSQHQFIPPCLTEVKLTTSLRSPPVITKEVMKAKHIQDGNVHNYTASDIPVLSDGPEPKRIKHRDQQGHTGHWPDNCMECGRQIARVLSDLGIKPPETSGDHPPLLYRDVLILCYTPRDDYKDSDGKVISTGIGLVRSLRECNVPVRVVETNDEETLQNIVLGGKNEVTVTHWHHVRGLEWKVVFVGEYYSRDILDRLHAVSRCSLQLVWID